ncbi:helix-turn-helix transcriptional regulator [candidate division WOR-3 bacterium]|nr:helix-turn-helix transcriptional regulator [candidate division WOR-3 bacterium]MCK4575098.1 helix-turn-helix transcriptional regulator [candidate division WOR-3 bacterium]
MHDKEFLKKIGKRIRLLRKSQELSQEELAELTELHPTYIGEIERATVNASIISFQKIAKALNMTLTEIFNTPSQKEEEKSLILQKILVLLRKQDVKLLRYIEKSITELTEFIKTKKRKKKFES